MSNLQAIEQTQILIFALDEPRYALNLSAVERVVRAVEITPLPSAPDFVLGVINVRGQIVTVVDIRQRLHLPRRKLDLNDRFILARTSRRLVALVVDSVVGIRTLAVRELVNADKVLDGLDFIHGLARLKDNLVIICDLDQFLSVNEERKLDAALARNAPATDHMVGHKAEEAV